MELKIIPFEELSGREVYDLLKLRFDIFVLEQNCMYPEIDGKDITAHHLLLKDEGEVIGTLRLMTEGPRYRIGRVAIDARRRGEKLGEAMMKFTLEYLCKKESEPRIELSAQTYLLAFYESLGFTAISDYYIEDGIEHVDMKWRTE